MKKELANNLIHDIEKLARRFQQRFSAFSDGDTGKGGGGDTGKGGGGDTGKGGQYTPPISQNLNAYLILGAIAVVVMVIFLLSNM